MKVDFNICNIAKNTKTEPKDITQSASLDISFDKSIEEKLKLLRNKKQNTNQAPLEDSGVISNNMVMNNDELLNITLLEPILNGNTDANLNSGQALDINNMIIKLPHNNYDENIITSEIINKDNKEIIKNSNDSFFVKDMVSKEVVSLNDATKQQQVKIMDLKKPLLQNITAEDGKDNSTININDISKNGNNKIPINLNNFDSEDMYMQEDISKNNVILNKNTIIDVPKIKVSDGILVKNENDFVNKVAQKILVNIKDGKTEFEINLFPKHLGKIKINILFEANKTILAITCSSIKTKGLIESNIDSIRSIIKTNTDTVSHIYLDDKESNIRDDRNNNQGDEQKQEKEQKENKQENKTAEETDLFIKKLRLGILSNSS